jgi:hypothetical protein
MKYGADHSTIYMTALLGLKLYLGLTFGFHAAVRVKSIGHALGRYWSQHLLYTTKLSSFRIISQQNSLTHSLSFIDFSLSISDSRHLKTTSV